MSTARRRLGTGPSTTGTTAPGRTAPRLLPAEQIEAALLDDVEREAVRDVKGRRTLGSGTSQEN
ncbi:hypothetical protein AB0M86_41295 [Streptomyces sp. NPDC051639]|uniref:hypothetical protein n=1 Tax=Streptomyces sp. NPDC051639 TaxID=3155671 RepID=UPI0034318AB6